MTTLVLALAGLTAGSGPANGAAAAQPTVNFAGHWSGTIKDDRDTRDLYLDDGIASWSRDGQGHTTPMRISLDGKGRAVVTWQGTYCLGCGFIFGAAAMDPIPWCELYRGTYEVQGDRVVLHLGPGSPTRFAFFKPAVGAVRITLEPVKARR
jgi:hypothetical protein